jgi:hypothetical protein
MKLRLLVNKAIYDGGTVKIDDAENKGLARLIDFVIGLPKTTRLLLNAEDRRTHKAK